MSGLTIALTCAMLALGLFGIGAFWFPFLCLLGCILFFGKNPGQALLPLAAGGLLLIVTTGSLLAFKQATRGSYCDTLCPETDPYRARRR